MKIFSNFDTNLSKELYDKYSKQFWSDRVLILFRNRVFLFFYVIIPFIFYLSIIVWLFFLFLLIDLWDETANSFLWLVYWLWVLISFLVFGRKLLKRLIDFYMDFTIITPDYIITYVQNWILSRDARSLSALKLKTISIEKDWLIRSLFNFWNIKFLSEWDTSNTWDIHIFYISDPDKRKREIKDIFSSWRNPDVAIDD